MAATAMCQLCIGNCIPGERLQAPRSLWFSTAASLIYFNFVLGLFGASSKDQSKSKTSDEPVFVGDIEVALVMTLEEFEFQILSLPALSGLSLPTPGFLRVRMVESGYMSTVLKGPSQTLQ